MLVPKLPCHFFRRETQPVSKPEDLATASRDPAKESLEIAYAVFTLGGGSLVLCQELEQSGIYGLAELAAAPAPIEEALVFQGRHQPCFRVADTAVATHERDKDLLYQIFRILFRDLVVPQDALHPRLELQQDALDDLVELFNWTIGTVLGQGALSLYSKGSTAGPYRKAERVGRGLAVAGDSRALFIPRRFVVGRAERTPQRTEKIEDPHIPLLTSGGTRLEPLRQKMSAFSNQSVVRPAFCDNEMKVFG